MARYAKVSPADTVAEERDESRILPAQLVPPTSGMKPGWRWLAISNVTADNSTGNVPTVSEPVVEEILAAEVRRTTTIRDMTAPEIDARNTSRVASEVDLALGRGLKLAFNALFLLANTERARHSLGALTMAQFRTAVENLDDINDTAFRDWLKSLL